MKPAWIAVVILGLAAGTAAAEEEERSERTALALSAGGAVASAALVTVAIVDNGQHDELGPIAGVVTLATPSLGQWYAGKAWSRGMTLRVAGGLALGVGYLALLGKCTTHGDPGDGCNETRDGILYLGPGALAVAAGVAYDVVTAPRTARRRNQRDRTVMLTPQPRGLGLAVAGRF
jgi:hypothetical protein